MFRYLMGYIFWRSPKNQIPGTDVAGVIEEVGSKVTSLKRGDEVFGSVSGAANVLGKAFAEYALVSSDSIIVKPPTISFEEAAGAVMSGLTAKAIICDVAKVQDGTKILINGASGGVGTFCVHWQRLVVGL